MKSLFNKLRFSIERKSVSYILWILSLISVFLFIKSANGNTIIYDLSMGFIVSVIFYLIVVYLPEKRKRDDIEPLIFSKCESLIFSCYALINTIIEKSKLDYKYKTLTKTEFLEICKNVNPKMHQFKFAHNLNNLFENHLGYKIYNDWTRIITQMDEILRLSLYVDSGLLKKIYSINNSHLRYIANDMAYIEKFKNDNLEAWSDILYDFYLATKELRDYFNFYVQKEFKNDPWK